MKAVERKNDVKAFVRKRQRAHIALPERDVGKSEPRCLFLRYRVGRVVEAGNLRPGERLVKRHGQNARSDRNLQKAAGKLLRNAGKRLCQIAFAFCAVHCLHKAADGFSRKGGAGDHAVVKAVGAGQAVGVLNGLFSVHGISPPKMELLPELLVREF